MVPGPWTGPQLDPDHALHHPWQIREVVELQLRDSDREKQGTGTGFVEERVEDGIYKIYIFQVSDPHYRWWLLESGSYPNPGPYRMGCRPHRAKETEISGMWVDRLKIRTSSI
eukprot:5386530-Amphidinium_carterae.1